MNGIRHKIVSISYYRQGRPQERPEEEMTTNDDFSGPKTDRN